MKRTTFAAAAFASVIAVAQLAGPAMAQSKNFKLNLGNAGSGNPVSRQSQGLQLNPVQKFQPVQSNGAKGSINLQQLGNLNNNLGTVGRKPTLQIDPGFNVGGRLPGKDIKPIGIKPSDLIPKGNGGTVLNPGTILNPNQGGLNPILGGKLGKPAKVIDPGFGNGQQAQKKILGGLKNTILHCDWHDHGHQHYQHWNHFCQHQPSHCHWWFDYCSAIHTIHPGHYHHCTWHRCPTIVIVEGVPVVSQISWYLGLKGMILPGQGIGVESVELNSPAFLANLQPGMVLVSANGIRLLDEASMNEAIIRSNGLLTLEVVTGVGAPSQFVQIQLVPVQTAAF